MSLRKAIILALLTVCITSTSVLSQNEKSDAEPPGDRVRAELGARAPGSDAASRASVKLSPDYVIGAGDNLLITVRGRVDLKYGREAEAARDKADPASADQTGSSSVGFEVMPDGLVHLPLLGPVRAQGKTVDELRRTITDGLSAYYKQFTVDLSVSMPGLVKVWVSGQVANPGPQVLTSTGTVLEALLKADIQPTGSTRAIQLKRGGKISIIDAYDIVARGNLESNILLEAGDEIYVPPAINCVTVLGEVCRPGQFEMTLSGGASDRQFGVKDLIDLSLGLLPNAAPSRAIIERPGAGNEVTALHVNLSQGENPPMRPGDKLIVPSVSDYQPTIRLVGEFKGDNVYQRVAGAVMNRSGVYRLAKGETAGDVIVRTGGATPQADLRRAKIERRTNGKLEVIPLDLEKVLSRQDKSADVVLESGDTVLLPALMDKVYVFGQVARSGGFPYEPERRMMDYLANAGGPNSRATQSVMIVRGNSENPDVMKFNLKSGMKGKSSDNPVMQPGDVIYVPQKTISDWRDISQVIATARMIMLLF